MKYWVIPDFQFLAACETPSGRWVVFDGILLWRQGDNVEARRGYVVDFPTENADPIWVEDYPVDDDGNLNLDPDSAIRAAVIATADLSSVLTHDRVHRSVADQTILAEGTDGSCQWTLHRGIVLWREGDQIYALPGYIVSYRDGSVWTDSWPVDADGQLIADPSLYLDADVIAFAFGDLTPLL